MARAAPFVTGERLDFMAMLGQRDLALLERQADFGAHRLGQLMQEPAGKRRLAVVNLRLAPGRNAVDPPGPGAEDWRVGDDFERQVLEVRRRAVADREVDDDGDVVLMACEGDAAGDFGPDFRRAGGRSAFDRRCRIHRHPPD